MLIIVNARAGQHLLISLLARMFIKPADTAFITREVSKSRLIYNLAEVIELLDPQTRPLPTSASSMPASYLLPSRIRTTI